MSEYVGSVHACQLGLTAIHGCKSTPCWRNCILENKLRSKLEIASRVANYKSEIPDAAVPSHRSFFPSCSFFPSIPFLPPPLRNGPNVRFSSVVRGKAPAAMLFLWYFEPSKRVLWQLKGRFVLTKMLSLVRCVKITRGHHAVGYLYTSRTEQNSMAIKVIDLHWTCWHIHDTENIS